MELIAAIDQGTTSTRCILFNKNAEIISSDQVEHKQIYPKPGLVEHDPIEIVNNSYQVIKKSLGKKNLLPRDIAAVGITNQRETTVLWNKNTGIPYGNAIVWQDTRTTEICGKLQSVHGGEYYQKKTGLPIATYFSGPKIKWMFDNSSSMREDADKGEVLFGTIDTWLIWNFTGGTDGGKHVTDVTNASRTMLMNISTLDWDDQLIGNLDIKNIVLPKILPSAVLFGEMELDGFLIPIAGSLGDQQAALFGQTCFATGEAKNTYGTGCFLLQNTGNSPVYSKNGLITTVGYQIGNQDPVFCLEGSVAVAGALVQWLRDNLGLIDSSLEIEELAKSVPDNGGVYFVPAFSGLFAPYWNNKARGMIIGLTRFSNGSHIARAAIEATAYQSKEVLDAMVKDSNVDLCDLKVDGGMVGNELLMQFQADILNKPVVRPMITETTALGAAYAAGLSIGYWKSKEELKSHWKKDKTWEPKLGEQERVSMFSEWKKAVTRTLDWHE